MRALISLFARSFVLIVILSGCGGSTPQLTLESIAFIVNDDANDNTAVAVDMIVVYDATVLAELSTLTAAAYFAKKTQIQRDNADMIQLFEWQLVPGQFILPVAIEMHQAYAQGALIFGNYLNPGDHRLKLTSGGPDLSITLTKADLLLTPIAAPPAQ